MKKLKNKIWLLLILVFPVLLAAFFLRNVIFKSAVATWFDDNWHYRKAVQITNSSGSNLTDFQVNISIGTSALIASGKMQSDCDDIRITDANGKLLPHWIEENNPGCNQPTDTKIWVKAPTLPTSGATLYVYYGNSSATNVGNGNNVFEVFEDFSDLPSDWTAESSPSTNWNVVDGELVSTTVSSDYSSFTRNSPTFTDFVADVRWKYSGATHSGLNFRGQAEAADYGYQWIIQPPSNQSRIQIRNPNQSYPIPAQGLGIVLSDNTWYNISLKAIGDQINGYFNEAQVLSGDMNNSTYPSGKIGFQHYDGTNYFDNFRIRKAASTDPTTSLSSEEVSKAPIAYWKFDEGTGTTIYDSSSNQNNGSLGAGSSAPAWQTEEQCVSGKCLYFDGTDDYVNVSDKQVQHFDNNFTVQGWIKLNKTPVTDEAFPINKYGEYYIVLYTDGKLGYLIDNSDPGWLLRKTTYSIPTNEWVHVALTYSSSYVIKMYANGKEIYTYNGSGDIADDNGSIVIG
jgi:hypothetical protein